MDDARVDSRYADLIKNIYDGATFHLKIDDDLENKPEQRSEIGWDHLTQVIYFGVRNYLQKTKLKQKRILTKQRY